MPRAFNAKHWHLRKLSTFCLTAFYRAFSVPPRNCGFVAHTPCACTLRRASPARAAPHAMRWQPAPDAVDAQPPRSMMFHRHRSLSAANPAPAADAVTQPAPISRRQCLQSGLKLAGAGALGLLGGLHGTPALAGAQKEEFLVDSVRTALSAAISNSAPPIPTFHDRKSRLEYGYWLTTMSARIGNRMVDELTRQEFLQTLWYETARAGLEVSLVLGLIQVESNFRKYAISPVGARGLMQVMPFWTRVIGDGDPGKLFHMQTNLRFGCVILRHYLYRENGDLYMALGRYNGSRGKPQYPNAVFAAQKKWLMPQ